MGRCIYFFVTGAAGFIGDQSEIGLGKKVDSVVGRDNLNDYYLKSIKLARLSCLKREPLFIFCEVSIEVSSAIGSLGKRFVFKEIYHLALQLSSYS